MVSVTFVRTNLQIHASTTFIISHYRLLPLRSLASEIPPVEVPTASAQVARESQPAQVRHESIACSLINLTPDVDQPASDTSESHDISGRFNWATEAEEQRHPDQVQAELDRVESGAVLSQGDGRRVGAGGAHSPSAVSGVAHETVEDRPSRTEDPSWRASGAEGARC